MAIRKISVGKELAAGSDADAIVSLELERNNT